MSKRHEGLLAGAAAGCLAGVLLFAKAHSLAWQMYGGLMLLLSAAVMVATALAQLHLANTGRRRMVPARLAARRWVAHGRVVVPVRPRRGG